MSLFPYSNLICLEFLYYISNIDDFTVIVYDTFVSSLLTQLRLCFTQKQNRNRRFSLVSINKWLKARQRSLLYRLISTKRNYCYLIFRDSSKNSSMDKNCDFNFLLSTGQFCTWRLIIHSFSTLHPNTSVWIASNASHK